nr:MAG TPA: GLUTATHIONE S-TRANSFERASE, GLUTATHIONE [Bacteriophage sp.]DAY80978.1 MAG TPA: GLUTATHIONE S-TRANSFERASE, GLUTATHIONE [Caudoviricetes sp.]
MPLPLQAVLARMGRILIQGSALTIPIRRNRTLGAGQTL